MSNCEHCPFPIAGDDTEVIRNDAGDWHQECWWSHVEGEGSRYVQLAFVPRSEARWAA